MKISEIGEFGLIDMIAGMIAGHRDEAAESSKRLIIGIGDDAALWKGSERTQVATTDTLVEGVHFALKFCDWESLGWKALAVNLSDIAAMGAYPLYAFVSLSLPGHVLVQDVASFYNGMLDLCSKSGTTIAGGNCSSSNKVVITLAVVGEVDAGRTLLRSSAEPGDVVAMTGFTGLAAAGLKRLQAEGRSNARNRAEIAGGGRESESLLEEAFLRPWPRLKEAQFLAGKGVKAAIDVSDGLLKDLGHICESSKVEAEVNTGSVPVHSLLKEYSGRNALKLALGGGEDYELVFTASKKTLSKVKAGIGCPVTVIGKVTGKSEAGKLIIRDEKGKVVSPGKYGWEHFKQS